MRFIPAICAEEKQGPTKVVFGIPIPKNDKPYPQLVDALERSLPLIEAAGFEHGLTYSTGNPYISGARAEITRKAMDAKADVIVYLDYDISFDPENMVTLLQTPGEVVGGTYRCKVEENVYMGAVYNDPETNKPLGRADGCIKARTLPAGFLKVTTTGLDRFMRAYPELCYGPQYSLSVDLFNHGAHQGIWWGEDYAFCRNFEACGGECWLIPNMNIDHWQRFKNEETGLTDYKRYPGNFHEFMLRQPGGAKAA